ncbi:hypothetical protein Nepgr_000277 [Nepenthes gracilis]|uniref:NAC domain-containing protein n=1 Tax=Nepenthes gracilis TaxID=150966 RepID=A0AAD3P3B4_NEPGR|nr:hypothetical protein Nepgr_000277 [Nepenthes gracilis]
MAELPPGFRFYPTEAELISFYLRNKLQCQKPQLDYVIPTVDIYRHEPQELPKFAGKMCRGDSEQWFFFTQQQEREARGGRASRTTGSGYWKTTGSPGYVYSPQNRVIGVKKTMVFYVGKAPTGRKTKWKMNEYKAIEEEGAASSSIAIPKLRHHISLCRVYITSGCSRAFDRRPSAITTAANQIHGDQGTSAVSHNTVEKTSSPECACSREDHFALPFAEGNNPTSATAADEPLWEWEQLNWL